MSMNKWYGLRGHEVYELEGSLIEWAGTFESANMHVADTHMGDVRVSTVFLGMNHNHLDGPPLLFETMVFGGPIDGETHRYSTWAEAESGHNAMVARLSAQGIPSFPANQSGTG